MSSRLGRLIERLEDRRLMALPSGFAQSTWLSGLTQPTAMTFAPDGRAFVCEQGGTLRVVSADGTLLSTPFASLAVRNVSETGLIGVTLDPNFQTNRYVYVRWTTPTRQARVSRFTADASNPNVAAAGSQVDLLSTPVKAGENHQGGALAFGPDGKLYVAIGEHGDPAQSQSLNTPWGKILRYNPDGTIPTDNPFYGTAGTDGRAIYALGLRNPFTMAFSRNTGRLFVNDVGGGLAEEVNDVQAGRNYGWSTTEGTFNPSTYPQFTNPVHAFRSGACAITGAVFYEPPAGAANPWPAQYHGDYLFSDFCGDFIRTLDSANNWANGTFAPAGDTPGEPVDLDVGPDGSVYLLARGGSGTGTGVIQRYTYTASNAPSIGTQPQNRTVGEGQSATFTVAASGAAPLSYQWQRRNPGGAFADISGAASSSYTLPSAALGDSGAQFRCVVTNGQGSATSNAATLTVQANQAPTATITAPTAGTTYAGGQTINYSGTGTDPENGNLSGSAFTWRVDFHHDTHTHPFVPTTTGQTSGSIVVPTTGETSANVWYRIHLTVTDSAGLSHSTFRDVQPRTTNVTLATNPAGVGLRLELDASPASAPVNFTGVHGIVRSIGAPATQTVGGTTYEFVSWSDGGARVHDVSTPTAATTYTTTYRVVSPPSITAHPVNRGVNPGGSATFTVTAAGSAPLAYQWQRDGANIPGATSASYTLNSAQLADNGAQLRCVVTNAHGTATSNAATLTVADGQPPAATITTPAAGSQYRAGETVTLSGSGDDAEDGALAATQFTWWVDLHRGGAVTTALAPTGGSTSGSFTVPTTGDPSADAFYRVHLQVTDSDGLTHEVTRDVTPRTAAVTLATSVPGLSLTLDGATVAAPHTFTGVSGFPRTVAAPASQTVGDVTYDFVSWSDGGALEHAITTPDADATYTAVYQVRTGDGRYDLLPTVAGTLPPEVIGGQRGVAVVQLTNSGTELLLAPVTVKVFVSADATLDGSDALAGTVTRRIKLLPDRPRPVKVRLTYPALPDGTYHLLAQVDPDNTVPEASDANNAAASADTFLNHEPFIDLSATFPATLRTYVRGRRGSVVLTVLNGGNVAAAGALEVALSAYPDAVGPGGAVVLPTLPRPVKVRPRGGRPVRLSFLLPTEWAAGTYHFTATVDTANGFDETDESNNAAVSAGSFTLM